MGETYSTGTGMRNAFMVWCENLNVWDCLKNSLSKVLYSDTNFDPGQILYEDVD